MEIKERVNLFIKEKKISQRKFAISIGKSTAYVNNIIKNISSDVVLNISNAYPDLSIEWLITGEGSMLKSENTPVVSEPQANYGPAQNQDSDYISYLKETIKETIKDRERKIDKKDDEIKELYIQIKDQSAYIAGLEQLLINNGIDLNGMPKKGEKSA
jgi:transcriptional regulator with XRE-family HTH domain